MKSQKLRVTPKPRSDSFIDSLPIERRELLERWLFDENISYDAAVARAAKQFQVELSRYQLTRHYKKTRRRRNFDRILTSVGEAGKVLKLFNGNSSVTVKATVNLLSQIAFDRALAASELEGDRAAGEETGQKKPVESSAQRELLHQVGAALELLLPARKDDREERIVALEREKWEIDIVRIVEQHQAELERILKDESLDEGERLQKIRRRIFGDNLAPDQR